MRYTVVFFLLYCKVAWTQTEYHFSKLTVEDGLLDSHIQAIGQDKYGYMWFGTLSGLSVYDGRQLKQYKHRADDTTSILSEMAMSIVTDKNGRLFIGFVNGLAEYDFKTGYFRRVAAAKGKNIYSIFPIEKDLIFMITTEGVAEFNPNTGNFHFIDDPLLKGAFWGGYFSKGKLYLGSEKGLIIYDIQAKKAMKAPIPAIDNVRVYSVLVDEKDRIWLVSQGKNRILRVSADFKTSEVYDRYLQISDYSKDLTYQFVKDAKGRIWITTKHSGFLQYDAQNNSLINHLHDDNKRWSPMTNFYISLFCDKEGIIWMGGHNINYFHPDKQLFTRILPFETRLNLSTRRYARCVVEDKDHNLWFGTRDGVCKYDTKTHKRQEWRNKGNEPEMLFSNSIADFYCDEENNIWIGTSKGLNRYNRKTGQMEFVSGKNGFPNGYYKFFFKDQSGILWIGIRGDNEGLYTYDPTSKTLKGIATHPQLKRFVDFELWTMMQDSKGRFWYAFDENGLGFYDPKTQETQHWRADTEGDNTIAGNLIIDIKEDKKGIMWFSSFSGLTSFDTEKKIFTIHHHPYLNSASFALAVDSLDRLWVSTGSSLLVLDSSRTKFARFGVKEGLPAQEFLEQKSYTTAAGAFILGTQNGFVSFNPLDYATEKRLLNVYIGAYYENGLEKNMPKYDEDAKVRIELSANDNVLNLQLTAINFLNSEQTWYAYKLEGLEGNWHFTQDPKVIYINLPGGNYIFKYKATINPNDWDMPEKSVPIFVETVFYKSWWFWLFILVDIILVVYFLYRRQTTQRKQVFDLLSRAQALEKEKAVMQYEGLKQQLNPHFLFNSLTSLSSLIQIDPSVASRFLDNLSKTYRYILKSSESETVFLRDEIRFTQNFVALQKVRFETGLEVYFDIQEADLDKKVVPVTIQNMIENAIKHNIIDDESPLKILIYTTDTEGGYLIIKNNLQKKNFVESSNKRGLNNLTSLYKYFSNRSVEARENQDSFTVKIPLL